MQKILPLFFFLCSLQALVSAQTTVFWDGEAMTTSWNDPANWSGDVEPAAGDIVTFNVGTTVTGTVTNIPAQVRVGNGATLILDLDLTVGDGVTAGNTIDVFSGSRLVVENGRTLTLQPETNSIGISLGSGADNASVNIKGTATLNITGGKHGVNIGNPTVDYTHRGTMIVTSPSGSGVRIAAGVFTNLGGITITGSGQNAIDNQGTFNNEASTTTSITIDNAFGNAIKNKPTGVFLNEKDITLTNSGGITLDGICSEGSWTNTSSATIMVSDMNDDGIEVLGGTFENDGTISVALKAGLLAGNSAIAIGYGTAAASLTNTSNNTIEVTGAASSARAILLDALGTLTNTGTITLGAGDDGNRINSGGVVVNDNGGTLDLTDGRINNSGSLTNEGLILSTRGGSGIFNTGTVTNNAFFKYDGSNAFANGSAGTAIDNGISLNQFSARVIDVGGGVEVDIAETSYVWTYLGVPIGTSDATGLLTVDCALIDNDTINIRPEGLDLGDTPIRLRNVCALQLPVELTILEAVTMPKSVMIKWTTATETDNDYMAVERSLDGSTFTEIGRVNGAGTVDYGSSYELEDQSPAHGLNYYRLRQVDIDGTTNYSEVVFARFHLNEPGTATPEIYPTVLSRGAPLTLDLRNLRVTENFTFIITNARGQQLQTIERTGSTRTEIPTADLHPGLYFMLTSGEKGLLTKRFVVR